MHLVNRIHTLKKTIHRKFNADRACVPDHSGKEFEVRMWTISEFILKKLIPVVGVHPFPLNELSLMISAVCRIRPSHIFEWGTNIGVSARIFYETVQYFRIDSEIHTIDLPDDERHVEHPGQRRGAFVKAIKKVQMHQGDGAETALKLWNASAQKGQPLFFLDGDHQYETVIRELRIIFRDVASANFLIHDTLYQTEESNYNIGPFLAIEDFLKKVPDRFCRIDEHLGLPGMTLLYQKEAISGSSVSYRIS
jgi:cephalosporin hydroxylase